MVTILSVFLLAGMIKGIVGLGLPTVAMGLLALTMPPTSAAALLLIPSFVTNLWQLLAGPASFAILIGTLWSGVPTLAEAAPWAPVFLGGIQAARLSNRMVRRISHCCMDGKNDD